MSSKYGTIRGSSTELYLKNFDRYEVMPNVESGMERILEDDQYAFIWDPDGIEYHHKKHPCAISTIPNYQLAGCRISIYVQKNSELTELLNFQ